MELEWGFQAGQQARGVGGRLEIYNGRLGKLEPLSARGVVVTGSDSWHSTGTSRGRKGLRAEVFYVPDDAQEVRFRPSIDLPAGSSGLLTYHPNRTVVTVRTTVGTFSFAPEDLAAGEPILVPSLGFCLCQAGSHPSAKEYARQIAAGKAQTTRQRVRHMTEQSLARALTDQYTANRPPYPRPEFEPPWRASRPPASGSNGSDSSGLRRQAVIRGPPG